MTKPFLTPIYPLEKISSHTYDLMGNYINLFPDIWYLRGYSQIYCKMCGWRKSSKPWFYTNKNNFKNKYCCPFIFSITKTLYKLNQCFFPEEYVETFIFRLWPIATALGALIVTSLIFLQPSLSFGIFQHNFFSL